MGTRRVDVRISRWLSTGKGGSLSLAMAHGRREGCWEEFRDWTLGILVSSLFFFCSDATRRTGWCSMEMMEMIGHQRSSPSPGWTE